MDPLTLILTLVFGAVTVLGGIGTYIFLRDRAKAGRKLRTLEEPRQKAFTMWLQRIPGYVWGGMTFIGLIVTGIALVLGIGQGCEVTKIKRNLDEIIEKSKEVEVPNVVGLPLEEAMVVLDEKGFQAVGDQKRPNTLYEEGTVVEQKPSAGSKVKQGRLVQLVVSSDVEAVRVPYLLGLTIEQALSIAERRGFEIEKVDTVQSDTFAQGLIVAMKPDPDIRVTPGTKLRLYISAGPASKNIPVPNIIDLPVEKARAFLESNSLVMGEIHRMSIVGKGGIVVRQSPDPGVLLKAGDTVRVTVGHDP
jgi:beta-lactam-binding protein with PASTA domain